MWPFGQKIMWFSMNLAASFAPETELCLIFLRLPYFLAFEMLR